MNLRITLFLAILPIFTSLAFPARHRHLNQRFHERAPLQQVWLLAISVIVTYSSLSPVLSHRENNTSCISPDPANSVTERLNLALQSSGSNFVLSLCPNAQYFIQAPIVFTAPNQEISTLGYPTDSSRATLVVSGPITNGQGHTTAVDGTCANCDGIKLRNIQVNGNRAGTTSTKGGANIEMGGPNSFQVIEFVRSYGPRSWSCLHIAEGSFLCNNVVVQNNDIGPCGSDEFLQWADGISVSCLSTVVRNNNVTDPTDGGIVVFSPYTLVENNIIRVINSTLLGGINMVDYLPWKSNYTGTVVQNNIIMGGFAPNSSISASQKDGENPSNAIIKTGIAIGTKTWFVNAFGNNVSFSGTVLGNSFTGAFGYAIAISSARNFTVQGNTLFGNTSFIGSRGPNCSSSNPTPPSGPFIVQTSDVTDSNLQSDFVTVQDAEGLTCVMPPEGGDYWPYGGSSTSTL